MASYPASVKSFTYKVDNQDKVVASDVNTAYDEITAIQKQLGTYSDLTSTGGVTAALASLQNTVSSFSSGIDGGTP
jgi:hypothetical protein